MSRAVCFGLRGADDEGLSCVSSRVLCSLCPVCLSVCLSLQVRSGHLARVRLQRGCGWTVDCAALILVPLAESRGTYVQGRVRPGRVEWCRCRQCREARDAKNARARAWWWAWEGRRGERGRQIVRERKREERQSYHSGGSSASNRLGIGCKERASCHCPVGLCACPTPRVAHSAPSAHSAHSAPTNPPSPPAPAAAALVSQACQASPASLCHCHWPSAELADLRMGRVDACQTPDWDRRLREVFSVGTRYGVLACACASVGHAKYSVPIWLPPPLHSLDPGLARQKDSPRPS